MFHIKRCKELAEGLAVGTTVRYNHDECPAGTDRRRRLYITKADAGTIKVYCHNCSKGTVINLGRSVTPRRLVVPKAGSSLPPKPAPENPDRLIHPTHIRWLYAHGIPEKLALTFGVYSASKEELIFPHPYGLPTEAYLARHFDRPTSKWHKSGSLDYAIPKKHNTLICEDVLSALKWAAADPDNNGFLALQGHAVTRATTSSVFGTSEYTIVWLDNDKGSVIDSAATIASLVAPVSRTVLVLGGTDPKRYPKAELLKVKDECIKLWQSTPADGKPYHVFNVLSPGQGVCT